jgi:tetratricopeptide (TPR) repeat protein
MSLRLDAVGLGLAEGSQAENDLSTLVRASGNGTQYSAGNSEELVRAFRRASLSDQLKMSDPSQDPAVDAYLQAAYNETLEYIRNNDLLSALQVLKGVANEHPNAPSAQNNLSLLYEADGQTVSAINHAEAYLRLAPNALDAGDVRARLDQLRREQQQNPRAIFNPNECSTLYRWARAESMRISDATRKAKAYMIMNAAQRGDCGTANTEYENYTQTYGQN